MFQDLDGKRAIFLFVIQNRGLERILVQRLGPLLHRFRVNGIGSGRVLGDDEVHEFFFGLVLPRFVRMISDYLAQAICIVVLEDFPLPVPRTANSAQFTTFRHRFYRP